MGMFELGKMTLLWLFKKPATIQYPHQDVHQYPGRRGHIENDITACILCNKCARICPTDAIDVRRSEHVWSINPYRCVQCESCVHVCPTHALTMSPSFVKPTSCMEPVVHVKENTTR